MKRATLLTAALIAGSCSTAQIVCAQDDSAGWTGVTDPAAVIAARQGLMAEMGRLMLPIDAYTAGESVAAETIQSAAITIAQMLLATPHLFPPTTNIYDDTAAIPVTIAMPAIWQNFETFSSLSAAAASAANALERASDDRSRHDTAVSLRAACDACHALSMLPYEPISITGDDADFDFDSFFDDLDETEAAPD